MQNVFAFLYSNSIPIGLSALSAPTPATASPINLVLRLSTQSTVPEVSFQSEELQR